MRRLRWAGKIVKRSLQSSYLHRELDYKEPAMGRRSLPAEGTYRSKAQRKKQQEDRLAGAE